MGKWKPSADRRYLLSIMSAELTHSCSAMQASGSITRAARPVAPPPRPTRRRGAAAGTGRAARWCVSPIAAAAARARPRVPDRAQRARSLAASAEVEER